MFWDKGEKLLLMLAAGVLASPASFAWADGTGPGYGHSAMWQSWGWTGMIFASMMMIAGIAGVVLVFVLIVRWLGGGCSSAPAPVSGLEKTALDILKERFAKGEIGEDEFKEKRRILED